MRMLAVLVVVAACGASARVEPEAPRRTDKEALREARGLVDEAYRSLRAGDVSGLMGLLAPDLFFIGPGPADVGLDRAAALELGNEAIEGRKKHKLKSYGLELFAGPDGRSAYAIDQIEFDGTAFAVTVVMAEVGDLWTITTIGVSRAVSAKRQDTAAALAELPRWKPPTDARDPAHDKAPREMLEAFALAAADVDARLTQFGDGKDGAYVGPAPDEVILGAKALRKKWKKRAPAFTVDESLGGATPDGRLVWIVGNARDREPPPPARTERSKRRRGDDADAEPPAEPAAAPRRLFAIYRDDGGDAGWSLAVLHAAIALPR